MDSPSGRRDSPFKRSYSIPDISWRSLGHRHKFLLTMLGLLTLLCTVYLYFAVTLGTSDSCSGLGGAQRVRCQQLHANTLKPESLKAHHRRRLLFVEDHADEETVTVHSGGSKEGFLDFLKSWQASIKQEEESEITRLKGVVTGLQRTITSLQRSNARLRKTVTVLRKEVHHTSPEDDDTAHGKSIPVPPRTTRLRGDIR